MEKDLFDIILDKKDDFSKGQNKIAEYILNHYDKAAFMTAAKLGANIGVSESTVVRFASELGFDGYPALQRAVQDMIRNKLTSVQRIEVTVDRIGTGEVLDKVLNMDIDKIRRTLEQTSKYDFNNVVEAIVSAKNIYIIGDRSSGTIAGFLGYYFNLMFDKIKVINCTSSSEMFEQLMRITNQDILIGISFPRYSKRTVKALKFARDCGASVVGITDSKLSPLAQHTTHLLLARSDMASFVDSLVAPLSLVNALLVAVGLRKKDEISKNFSKLEHIWEEYEVYQKSDDRNVVNNDEN